jgi:signal transduction histidine kinase
MSTTTLQVADLRPVDLFDELDDAALTEFAAVARPFEAAAGEMVADAGAAIGVILLLDGVLETVIPDGDREEPTGQHRAPTWLGAIGALTRGSLGVRVRAHTDCRMARVAPDDFRRLAFAHTGVHDRVMRQVGPVMSRITAIEHNRERLAALGTMAAGLAHELNNPAAAARRAAAQMAEALEVVSATIGRFVHSGVEREDAAKLVALHDGVVAAADTRTALDALGAADAEDELSDRLEELGVAEPWRLAEPLAAAGVDQAWLDRVHALAGPATDAAVRWVAATLTARGLAAELQESTERMSHLVGAVKTYAYMDRGGLVEVDLHEGLETTLVVLGHKLKHTSIDVVRDYDRSLPKLTVRGSELNQVWTNLVDNAVQALGEHGTITIRTRREGTCAIVEVSDDGPGIPPDIREHVFDEFFTTKTAGTGTGLGLATAKRIVADRHDGSLTVDSEPGRTTFRVSLPFTQPA